MRSARRWIDSPIAPVRCRACWSNSMRRLPILTIGLAVSVLTLHAADISGIWLGSGTAAGRRGQVQDISFQFIQQGGTLTGKLYLEYGSAPILKGTIDGDK